MWVCVKNTGYPLCNKVSSSPHVTSYCSGDKSRTRGTWTALHTSLSARRRLQLSPMRHLSNLCSPPSLLSSPPFVDQHSSLFHQCIVNNIKYLASFCHKCWNVETFPRFTCTLLIKNFWENLTVTETLPWHLEFQAQATFHCRTGLGVFASVPMKRETLFDDV